MKPKPNPEQHLPISTPDARRILEKLDRPKPVNPFLVLTHAIWHCLYGSAPTDRTPDRGDIDAAHLMRRLRHLVILEME